jgi:hypothetical protein
MRYISDSLRAKPKQLRLSPHMDEYGFKRYLENPIAISNEISQTLFVQYIVIQNNWSLSGARSTQNLIES